MQLITIKHAHQEQRSFVHLSIIHHDPIIHHHPSTVFNHPSSSVIRHLPSSFTFQSFSIIIHHHSPKCIFIFHWNVCSPLRTMRRFTPIHWKSPAITMTSNVYPTWRSKRCTERLFEKSGICCSFKHVVKKCNIAIA